MLRPLIALTVLVAPLTLRASPTGDGRRFDPVERDLQGFTVHVDPALLEGEHAELGTRALSMLDNHLERITLLLEADRLEELRTLEIWIEHHHPELSNMQYHPSVGWLERHGHDPRLEKMVHIPRADQLLSRQQILKHPAVILHELAHSYHDQILEFTDPRIIRAFDAADDSEIYEEVLDHRGRKVRHYALSNHKEYFAEGTEAYLYRNDFHPFVAAELRTFDPVLFDLLEEIWGPLE